MKEKTSYSMNWGKPKKTIKCLIISFVIVACLWTQSIPTQAAGWYASGGRYVSHACGGINRTAYTNSREALQRQLNKGTKKIEIDFSYTTDGILVCYHGPSVKKSYQQYVNSMKKKGYTAMKAEDALNMIATKRNTYLIGDTQYKDIKKVYRELVRICDQKRYQNLKQHIVPQIYYTSQYDTLKSVYKFKNYIFTLYRLKPKTDQQYRKVGSFCKKKKIRVVTMPDKKVTKNRVKLLRKYGVEVFAHTINKKSRYQQLRKYKVYGVYTDFLI